MSLKVTQNIQKFNITVSQNETVIKLQPVLNTAGSYMDEETDPIFRGSEAYKFENGDKSKLDKLEVDITKKLDKPLSADENADILIGLNEKGETVIVRRSASVNKIETISMNGEVLPIVDRNVDIPVPEIDPEMLDTKLDKITTTTEVRQLYAKDVNGNQIMVNFTEVGGNFILPQAVESTLGGVKAQAKTTDDIYYTTPVKIASTGLLYVPQIVTPQVTMLSTTNTLSAEHDRKVYISEGTNTLTIPLNLGSVFNEFGVIVNTGTLTIILTSGVTLTGYYTLTFNAGESFYICRKPGVSNSYILV